MVVKNNMSAVKTLNVLNANSAALAKDLQQVATGMKVNSAADDNSGYAISERMQVRIRALEQADQNTQNGANMLKVAEGAVSSTVDILKTMKEKAINAANDSNTDADRATIQKELDQSIDQIDDNALITYNSKTLVDGSRMAKGEATKTSLTNQSLHESTKGTTKIVDLMDRNGLNLNIQTTDTLTISYVIQGRTYTSSMKVDGSLDLSSALDRASETYTENSPVMESARNTRDTKIALAGQVKQAKYDQADADYVTATDGADAQYTHQVDLATGGPASYTSPTTTNTVDTTLGEAIALAQADVDSIKEMVALAKSEYDAAVADGNSINISMKQGQLTMVEGWYNNASGQLNSLNNTLALAKQKAQKDKDEAYEAADTEYNNTIAAADAEYDVAVEAARVEYRDSLGEIFPYDSVVETTNVVGKDATGDTVYTANGENAVTIKSLTAGVKYQLSGLTFSVADSKGQVKKSVNAVLDNFTETVRAVNKSNDNAITLQMDAKANQTIRISLTDMRSEALGLKSSDGTTLSVATQKHANAAVNVLDNAIKKALDQQTDIGAVANRMEQTSNNLHIARDNVQASESTIRDADMAKAMTSYTKNNILLQAAQSMLAQANQSSSNVLSLLQ